MIEVEGVIVVPDRADFHIVGVSTRSGPGHALVMTADGTILNPASRTPYGRDRLNTVEYVIGLTRKFEGCP